VPGACFTNSFLSDSPPTFSADAALAAEVALSAFVAAPPFSFGVGAVPYLTAFAISLAILGREFGTASRGGSSSGCANAPPRRSPASRPRADR